MKNTKTFLFAVLTILFVRGSSVQAYLPIVDLGNVGSYGEVRSINDDAQIVGYNSYSNSAWLFLGAAGANIDLGGLGYGSCAWSINDGGQIVGGAGTSIGSAACLFDSTGGKANKDLGYLGGHYSVAYSINDSGQIVGWADIAGPSYYSHACLFDSTGQGNNMDLGTLGGIYSDARSINNNGQIVGAATNSSGDYHACLFNPTGNIDLGTFPGGSLGYAYSINDSGQIVGLAEGSDYHHACLFDSTGQGNNIDLGTLGGLSSEARSINNSGQIVGTAQNSSGWLRPCLFDPTGQGNNIDLNSLIDPLSGWTLMNAYSINNDGWIVGMGVSEAAFNNTHAYLLIPEPTTLFLLGLGSLALLRKRRV